MGDPISHAKERPVELNSSATAVCFCFGQQGKEETQRNNWWQLNHG